jgi:hypothetical protein
MFLMLMVDALGSSTAPTRGSTVNVFYVYGGRSRISYSTRLGAHRRCFLHWWWALLDLRQHLSGGPPSMLLTLMVGTPRYMIAPPRATTSSTILVSAAFSGTTTAAKTSLAVEVYPPPQNPLGAIDAATLVSGCGAVAVPRTRCLDSWGPLTVDPPLWNCLLLLCWGSSFSSDDSSVLLSTIQGNAFPFSLPELGPVLTPPWLPATTTLGI